MTNKTRIEVENKLISIIKQDEQDFICLTDMVRDEEGTDHIRNESFTSEMIDKTNKLRLWLREKVQ